MATSESKPMLMCTESSALLDFAPAEVNVDYRADGSIVLRSPQAIEPVTTMNHVVDRAARVASSRVFLAERSGSSWRTVDYQEAREAIRAIGGALIERGASVERPLMILSDNSVDVGLLTLGAHYVGIPVVHTTSAYATQSHDFERLRSIAELTRPAVVYADEASAYGRALREAIPSGACVVLSDMCGADAGWQPYSSLRDWRGPAATVDDAAAAVTLDTPARLLFTSGSTGLPKGVIHTHGMLGWNAQARAQLWPYLDRELTVFLDWMPWSHGFGSSQNFTMALWHQGSFYIDDGRPVPGQIERTVENIKMVKPTIMCSVPLVYQILQTYLDNDEALGHAFFGRMRALFYAGADMPRPLWRAYEGLARRYTGRTPHFTSSWGMTEVVAATYVHYPIERAGNIGLPMPGAEIKLAPVDDKLELRVRGLGTTTGYWKQPELTEAVFDEEGFFRTGDAGKLWDPARPQAGLAYDGRIGENFKLTSGRWVPVGDVRMLAIAEGAPVVSDVVVAGHGRDDVALLVFLDLNACRNLSPELAACELPQLAAHQVIRSRLSAMLRVLATGPDGLPAVRRAIAMPDAPVPGEEIGEKGYINQRAVLTRRAAYIERLYGMAGNGDVIGLDEADHD